MRGFYSSPERRRRDLDSECHASTIRPEVLIVMCFRSLLRRTALVIAVILLVHALASAQESSASPATPAPEGEETAPPPATPPEGEGGGATKPATGLREQTIYVPFEKLDEVFEKKGRGVFLPYEEFLELWRAGQPKSPVPVPDAPPASSVVRTANYEGNVDETLARVTVRYEVESLEDSWVSLPLPLRNVAIESFDPGDSGILLTANSEGHGLLIPRRGKHAVSIVFSTRVRSTPGRRSIAFGVPVVPVSKLQLSIPEHDARVTVAPDATTVTVAPAGESATIASVWLGSASELTIEWTPPAGRAAQEAAVVFANQAIRATLGERILRIRTRIAYEIERGEIDTLTIQGPAGTSLLRVDAKNVREWQENDGLLVVRLHSPVKESFLLDLEYERILTETPDRVTLPLPQIRDVRREAGWLALGHDPSLKLRVVSSVGLSQLDPEEVPEFLRADLRAGYRFLAPPAPLEIEVERVLPRVHSRTVSVVVLGREEDSWLGFVDYQISQAGVFRLELRVPRRWNVAEIGEPGTIEDFQSTTSDPDDTRTVTVNLKTRVLGDFRLPFRFIADGSASQNEVTLVPPRLLGTTQDAGVFAVTAPRSLDLATVERSALRSADVDELFRTGILGRVGSDTGSPLTWSYHENSLESPASVRLRVEPRKSEINVLSQLLVEVTDDRIRYTHFLDHEILYREIESLRFSAPSTLDERLKIESRDIKERRRTPSAVSGRTEWEITLQAPTVGNVFLTITHEEEIRPLAPGEPQRVQVPILRTSGTVASERGFVAVQKGGTLEVRLDGKDVEELDPSQLPDKLRRGKIHAARRFLGDAPTVDLVLTRYDYERLAETVVNALHLTTVLSDRPGRATTRARLLVRNLQRPYLELLLPQGASLIDARIAGKREKPKLRKEGVGYLFPIASAPGEDIPLVLLYQTELAAELGSFGHVEISGPTVLGDVPVQSTKLDLFTSPESIEVRFTGNLVRRARAPVDHRDADGEGFELTVDYLEHHAFDSNAPVVVLGIDYTSLRWFQAALGLSALLVFVLAWIALRWSPSSSLIILAVAIAAPLGLHWLLDSPADELGLAGVAGGALCAFAFALGALHSRYKAWRELRRSLAPLAPDPWLEEAVARPTNPTAPEASESPSTPPSMPESESEHPGDPPAAGSSGSRTRL
jgi:hypothetical protein